MRDQKIEKTSKYVKLVKMKQDNKMSLLKRKMLKCLYNIKAAADAGNSADLVQQVIILK